MGVIINMSADAKNGSDCSATTSLPVLVWQIPYSSHKSETAPWILSLLTEISIRKKDFQQDVGHSSDLDQKQSGTPLTKKNQEENGIESLN